MTIAEVLSLLGGVGLFLFGMSIMSTGLKNSCGDNLQVILEKATTNKAVAVFVGLLMTVLVQSSSATDVMVIGFVNSGMMTLAQAIGVILGANIGTTITAQITAFNIATFTPFILFIGAVMYLFMKKDFVLMVQDVNFNTMNVNLKILICRFFIFNYFFQKILVSRHLIQMSFQIEVIYLQVDWKFLKKYRGIYTIKYLETKIIKILKFCKISVKFDLILLKLVSF